MRIAFNLLPYQPGANGGAEVYLRHLVAALGAEPNDYEVVLVSDRAGVESYRAAGLQCEMVNIGCEGGSRLRRCLYEQTLLPRICRRHGFDYIVSNYVSPVMAPCKQIVVMHDMLFKRFPELLEPAKRAYWRVMIPLSIARSHAVLTVSQFSANEIRVLFPGAAAKLWVTTEGIKTELAHAALDNVPSVSQKPPYILCVATFGEHKNLGNLIEAFNLIAPEYPSVRLVLTGTPRTPDARACHAQIMTQVERLHLADQVLAVGHVADAELASLYSGAAMLALPSRYEGFGLPVIEAHHFGCPVVCSDRASLPEVAGAAAVLFDPEEPPSIATAMRRILSSPDGAANLRVAARKNAARFTWKKAAEQFSAMIEWAALHEA